MMALERFKLFGESLRSFEKLLQELNMPGNCCGRGSRCGRHSEAIAEHFGCCAYLPRFYRSPMTMSVKNIKISSMTRHTQSMKPRSQ